MSSLVFNLLCAPCFAAIGAIKREMASTKWTWFAIGYQTALAILVGMLYLLFRKSPQGKAARVQVTGSMKTAL